MALIQLTAAQSAAEQREAMNSNLNYLYSIIHPVGSIYITTDPTNPGEQFGGTWAAWGSGRVPVGVDTSQTEFNTAEKTGGEKTHTLSKQEIPDHYHKTRFAWGENANFGVGDALAYLRVDMGDGGTTGSDCGGQAHNNLPPFITCYMWKRTA